MAAFGWILRAAVLAPLILTLVCPWPQMARAATAGAPGSHAVRQPGDGRTLAYGETVAGMLDDQQYEQRWTFTGARGDIIRLVMARLVDEPGGLDGYLILIGPDGATLLEVDDAPEDVMPAIERFELPDEGAYTVVATRFGFANGLSVGEYTLTLDRVGTAVAPPLTASAPQEIRWLAPGSLPPGLRLIAYNSPVSGALTPEDYEDWYTFRGRAGDTVTLRMSAGAGGLDPFLILTTADGHELARNDDDATTGESAISAFTLPADGSYLIRATRYGFANGPSSGEYTLIIETDAAPVALAGEDMPATRLDYGQVVSGALDFNRAVERYTFEGRAGELVTISARRASGDLKLALVLRDPGGETLAASHAWPDVSQARIVRFRLPADGRYALEVQLEELTTSGAYRLIALALPPDDEPAGAFVPAAGLDLELVLIWASGADLDLAASGPPGSADGEVTARANDFCADRLPAPVERVVWSNGTAAPGVYAVSVRYQLNCDGQREPVAFLLALATHGETVQFVGGTLAREGDMYTALLDFRP